MSDRTTPKPHQPQSPLHRLLQTVVGFALRADADSKRALQAFDGKRLRLDCTLPREDLTLSFFDGELLVQPTDPSDPPAHALIRGTGPALLKLLLTGSPNPQVTLDGDLGLVAALTALARNYDPDLSTLFSQGETSIDEAFSKAYDSYSSGAGQLRAFAEEALALFTSAAASTGRQAKSELREHFADHSALDDFLAQLHELKLAVDRLDAGVTFAERKRDADA